MNAIFNLPTKSGEDGVFAVLPEPVTVIPREKPVSTIKEHQIIYIYLLYLYDNMKRITNNIKWNNIYIYFNVKRFQKKRFLPVGRSLLKLKVFKRKREVDLNMMKKLVNTKLVMVMIILRIRMMFLKIG